MKKKGQNRSSKHLGGFSKLSSDTSKRLIVKQKTIRVLLNTGSSGDLLFIAKGSQKYIPTLKRAVPQSGGTSNGTFITKKVGEISLSFVEYSASKSINLVPDIVEYEAGASEPLYDLIIGKQTLHDIGKGYSVLLANCPAICSVIFVTSCHFCMGQNILVNELIFFRPFILFFVRIVDIFHSITNEWAKLTCFSFIF